MKVAFYMTTVLENAGGMEQYFIDTAKELSAMKDTTVDIITLDDQFTLRLEKMLDIYYLKKAYVKNIRKREEVRADIRSQLGTIPYHKMPSFRALSAKLKEYDVIYAKNELLEAMIFASILRYVHMPPVVFCCATPLGYPQPQSIREKLHNFLYQGRIYAFLTKGVTAFHVKNMQDEHIVKRMFPKKRVTKIPNAINIRTFTEHATKYVYPYQWDSRKFNIVWVGRLTMQKGIDRLVNVIRMLNDGIRYDEKIFWHIAGDGEEKETLKKETRDWKNVHLHGHIPHEQMPSVYRHCDLLLSTSRWESFGLTLIEANASGIPAVAYDIPGPNEIIVNGQNGFLITNEREMADTIRSLIDHERYCSDPTEVVRKKFSSEQHSVHLYDLLKYAAG